MQPDRIHLEAMSEAEFEVYLPQAVREYAQDKIQAGNWSPEQGLQLAQQEFQRLLPEGVHSPKQHLFTIRKDETGEGVGMIWYAELELGGRRAAFVYDFSIDEAQRRRGYGLQALQALEQEVKKHGLDTISLHVFGHNQAARLLYEKAGYEVTDINMTKKLT